MKKQTTIVLRFVRFTTRSLAISETFFLNCSKCFIVIIHNKNSFNDECG